MAHKVSAKVYNIDTNEYEVVECEVSDDLYKVITNGLGKHFSMDPSLFDKRNVERRRELNEERKRWLELNAERRAHAESE